MNIDSAHTDPSREPVSNQRWRRPGRAIVVALLAMVALLAGGVAVASFGGGGPAPVESVQDDGAARRPILRPEQEATRGDPLPTMELIRHDGTTVDLADRHGKPTVINFFTSWCGSCVAEMPQFETVHRELAEDVGFLGVASVDTLDNELGLIERTGVTYETVRDPRGNVMTALGVLGLPSTLFVNAQGEIVEYHIGELHAKELRSLIDKYLLP